MLGALTEACLVKPSQGDGTLDVLWPHTSLKDETDFSVRSSLTLVDPTHLVDKYLIF
jgi:hypothetical protein